MIGKAQSLGWGVVASIETDSAETPDDFIAHLAVGCKAGQLKAGGLRGGEFNYYSSNFNQLKFSLCTVVLNPPRQLSVAHSQNGTG